MTSKYSLFTLQLWELIWCVLILLVGSVGNSVVIVVTFRSKDVRKSSPFNVFILILAIIDLLASILVVPDYVLRTDIYSPPSGHTGTILCKLVIGGLIPFSLLGMSLYLLVAICLERRKVILHPFSALHDTPLWKSLLVVLAIILLSVFNQAPTIYGIYYNKTNSTSGNFCAYKTHRKASLTFHFLSFFLESFIPAVIFLVSFYQISKRLSSIEASLVKSSASNHQGQYNSPNEIPTLLVRRRSTVRTMRVVVAVIFVCIIPNEIVYMLFEFVPYYFLEMNSPLFQVTVLMRYSNCCLNPLLYSFTSREFRKHFLEVFPCLKKKEIPVKYVDDKKYSVLV